MAEPTCHWRRVAAEHAERRRQDALAHPAVQEALAAAEAELGALSSERLARALEAEACADRLGKDLEQLRKAYDRLNAMWVDANSHALSLQDHVRRYEQETAQAEDERDTWRRHYRNLLRAHREDQFELRRLRTAVARAALEAGEVRP